MTRPKIDDVLRVVGQRYGLMKADILSPCRQRRVAFPRHVAMYVARELTAQSFPALGRRFNRDWTTVSYAVYKIRRQKDGWPFLRRELDLITKALREKAA